MKERERGRDAGSEIGGEWKAMEEMKGMMEKMWEDQRRGMEGLRGGDEGLERVMEQLGGSRKRQEERRDLVERLEKRLELMGKGKGGSNSEGG